jgi:hypothetical protein
MAMRDLRGLRNAQVRSKTSGRQGRIENISAPWVNLNWYVPNQGVQRQCVLRTDPILDEDFEILTMDQGWVPIGNVVGSRRLAAQQREHLEQIAASRTSSFDEMFTTLARVGGAVVEGGNPWNKSPQNNWRKNPKERGPTDFADNPKKDGEVKKWKCKGSNYKYKCKGVGANAGQEKDVEVSKSYKGQYNNKYRKFFAKKSKAAKGADAAGE